MTRFYSKDLGLPCQVMKVVYQISDSVDDEECIWISDTEKNKTDEEQSTCTEKSEQECRDRLLEVIDSELDNPDDYVLENNIINKIKKQRKLVKRRKKRFFAVKKA